MKLILLIIISYIIGFFTAIPIGTTQVEIARRSISDKAHLYETTAQKVCRMLIF